MINITKKQIAYNTTALNWIIVTGAAGGTFDYIIQLMERSTS